MKTTITLFTLFLVLALVQTQVIASRDNLSLNVRPLPNLLGIAINSADCFEGTVTTKLNEQNKFESTYVACFVPATDCRYTKCHKGFIVNYTSQETGLVEGFPKNTEAVFRLDVISAANYSIRKSSNLSPQLSQIIDIACHQFDPTITTPPKPITSTSLSNLNRIASIVSASSSFYNLLQGQKFVYTSNEQRTYIPQYSFRPSGNNIFSLTAPTQKLVLSDFEGDAATVDRSIRYDSANSIIQERSDIVGLKFTNTAFEESKEAGAGLFQGKISLTFNKLRAKQQFRANELDDSLSKISTVFSLADLQKLRTIDNLRFKVYPQADKQDSVREQIPANGAKVGNLDRILASRTNIITEITDVNPVFSASVNSALGGPRLLSQVIIFSKQYPLYQKTVLGKTIKVSILVIAKLVNNQVLVITGTLRLNFFGVKKDIVVFNRSQNVNYNWSYNHTFSGSWSFNIYVPLPPPVSFLGINFGFTVSYSIPVSLSSTGSTSSVDFYQCTFATNVGASLNVDASAALRAIVVEGGVFIKGTLVSLRTDPKLVLKYFYMTNKLNVALSWYFYVRAFSFKWGFFWRYWRLFSGWSSKKIIAQWTISNPAQKKYPIWNFSKNYQL